MFYYKNPKWLWYIHANTSYLHISYLMYIQLIFITLAHEWHTFASSTVLSYHILLNHSLNIDFDFFQSFGNTSHIRTLVTYEMLLMNNIALMSFTAIFLDWRFSWEKKMFSLTFEGVLCWRYFSAKNKINQPESMHDSSLIHEISLIYDIIDFYKFWHRDQWKSKTFNKDQ